MRSSPSIIVTLGVLTVLTASGCSTCRPSVRAALPEPAPAGVVFAADGAGDFRAASKALKTAVSDTASPVHVETFVWSHGYCRLVADQVDHAHARAEGRRLAEVVIAHRQAFPGDPIFLMGHCAGGRVVLAAAEALPPGTIDRIVLLAPSLPADYDLRPALRCATDGIDVFCSRQDYWYLGVGILLLSPLQGCYPVSGYGGFEPVGGTPEDGALYAKLRQYHWRPGLEWTGHNGGHYGSYQQGFLRAIVLPLLHPAAQAGPELTHSLAAGSVAPDGRR